MEATKVRAGRRAKMLRTMASSHMPDAAVLRMLTPLFLVLVVAGFLGAASSISCLRSFFFAMLSRLGG
jgi:hypothetical protein